MTSPIINLSALEPLYLPHEMPTHHRVRAKKEGEPAELVKGRRPSDIVIAQNLRHYVTEWRDTDYAGASDTTRELLYHWFDRDHTIKNSEGDFIPFRYYFCQREALETFIFLREVRGLDTLSGIVSEFGGDNREIAALGIDPEEDLWAKYAFKVATGAGKTKIMSLAIVWSYFHALRESYSPMAKHFVVVAPNLTVFERLKEDFGDGAIFDRDPLIPIAWRGDWNLSVVLQDDATGAVTSGTLYLTNIHRLYETGKRQRKKDAETYDWMGPAVSKAKALDTGEALRERITSHKRIMVLNDEAHHVWDPDSAWNEAITYLNDTIRKRGGEGIVAHLDFSATPKDNKGNIFKHVICDAPLGEAVDAGIVKSPIIGRGEKLIEQTSDDDSIKYQQHLMIGYSRWLVSKEEWEKSGKKALLFVMTEDTESASQIANRLNTDSLYKELNGKTINLHTRLKGKLKKRGKGEKVYYEFIEDEKEISDEDLKELRKLSRELDSNKSPYLCIVSVLMLREGWDVKNVTTIVPLRPYSSKANILPEQTLGRGLRRMTPPGQAAEVVTVVEHKAFVNLYKDQLSQEGLPIEVVDINKVPKTTVTIYPDKTKDFDKLDILIPSLSAGYKRSPKLENITIEDIKKSFSRFSPLPIGEIRKTEIDYEGRHLFTNEIIEKMKVQLPLLESGVGAISFYCKELEAQTRLTGLHSTLAPLIQTFLEEILFEKKVGIFDDSLISRLSDADVREHIRATFVPLILSRTTYIEDRLQQYEPVSVCNWKPFQVTHSETRPTLPAENTPFNLVPCNREFEVAMTTFLNRASDVQSFCKNAGPQSLRIDYLSGSGRLSFYTPDFIVSKKDGNYLLVETKGREDIDVPLKATAAVSWCKAASSPKVKWQYLYVPQAVFSGFTSNKTEDLVRTCAPSLQELIRERAQPQLSLPLGEYIEGKITGIEEFINATHLDKLPSRYKKSIEQAIAVFQFFEKKEGMSFAPVFTALLGPIDESAKGLITDLLLPLLPAIPAEQKNFFAPYYGSLNKGTTDWLRANARNLEKTLVFKNGLMPIGLLKFCLEYSQGDYDIGGVFDAAKQSFFRFGKEGLYGTVKDIYDFRNTYIAHQEKELTDIDTAREGLMKWIRGLYQIYFAHH
ncbi:MAG: DEAD/DEAH box helicase family protein [Nitrospirae bacterium]|nr:DEAD/DEAH box helicase family protein [Nitrospirota bacterium]